ncbi:PadR family transcriptional regulator [Thermoactinospora rubra]|uniref:PadR family transcriptional regulator n=1 Tax=Thermoactinospora rubra TaxID=1088767 RepID=UPI00197E65F5|nr:helix-turn-helix transcriptional regulator [Thermoactinospora rubra]
MIRFLGAVGFAAIAILIRAENPDASTYAALVAVVLLFWLASANDWWTDALRPPRRVDGIPATKSMRRVLTVLLSDAPGLSGLRIADLGKVGYGNVYICLDRLEMAGWIRGEWEPERALGPRRRFYRLTPAGRAHALELLQLGERKEHAP